MIKPTKKRETVSVSIPTDIFFIVWKSKDPKQSLNNRFEELIKKGLATDDENR
jgi:hypothetical protein